MDQTKGGFMKIKLISLLATTLTLSQAFANHFSTGPKIGSIAYAGTGCPAGTARIDIQPGRARNQITFLFDSYSVTTDGRAVARQSCNLAIPVEVPKGYALLLPQVSLKGKSHIQVGDKAKLNAEVFLAGGRNSLATVELDDANDGYFSFAANGSNPTQAPCGASVNLRVNTSVSLIGNYNTGSYVNIDKLKFHLPFRLVACR
jgi:hypothetical protein